MEIGYDLECGDCGFFGAIDVEVHFTPGSISFVWECPECEEEHEEEIDNDEEDWHGE